MIKKLMLIQIILLVIGILGLIPLGMELFGDMNHAKILLFGIITGIGIIGSCIFGLIRVLLKKKFK